MASHKLLGETLVGGDEMGEKGLSTEQPPRGGKCTRDGRQPWSAGLAGTPISRRPGAHQRVTSDTVVGNTRWTNNGPVWEARRRDETPEKSIVEAASESTKQRKRDPAEIVGSPGHHNAWSTSGRRMLEIVPFAPSAFSGFFRSGHSMLCIAAHCSSLPGATP